METIYISERDGAVWNQLETKLKVIYVDNSKYLAIINFVACEENIDLRKIQELVAKYPSVDFRLYFNYNFTKIDKNLWVRKAKNQYYMQRDVITKLGNDIYKHIIKAYFVYKFPYNSYKYELEKLKEIKQIDTGLYSEIIINCDNYNIKMNLQENTREGWLNVWTELRNRLENNDVNSIVFPDLRIEIELQDGNKIENLKYFLPLRHHYAEKFNIQLMVKYKKESDIEYRLKDFFAVLDDYVLKDIYYGKFSLQIKTPIGESSCLSILSFDKDEKPESIRKYDDLIRVYLEALITINEKRYVGTDENEMSAEEKETIRDSVFYFLLNKLNVIFGNENNFIIKIEDNNGDLEEYEYKIDEIVIHGKNIKIYDEAKWLDFENKILKFLNAKMNKFEILIFLYIIRNHIDNKVLFVHDGEKWLFNEYVADKTWTDSKTYAEGLLQLIENAQQHSNGIIAYFGMRLYKADPNVSMSKLAEETRTREMLWKKYWHDEHKTDNIFNKKTEKGDAKYSDFLEFYVLDDAIGDAKMSQGIIDKINETDTLKTKINSINEIFLLTEESYVVASDIESKLPFQLLFCIQHYGMRWFKKHIDNLDGIMEIYSPCADKKDGNARCFSNVFEKLEEITPNNNNLYFTEYSILVPLNYK